MRLLLCLFLLFAVPAWASPVKLDITAWHSRPQAKVRLIYGRLDDGRPALALETALATGWHSYWKYAGASGFAPLFDWTGSAYFKPAAPLYETPQRFFDEAGDYFGYEAGSLIVFPIEDAQSEAIKVVLNLRIGVCQKICVPLQFAFAGEVIAADFNHSPFQPLFDQHKQSRPQPPSATLKANAMRYDGQFLYIELHSTDRAIPELIIGGKADDEFGRPHYIKQTKNLWQVRVAAHAAGADPLIGRSLELILMDTRHSVQQFMAVAPF